MPLSIDLLSPVDRLFNQHFCLCELSLDYTSLASLPQGVNSKFGRKARR